MGFRFNAPTNAGNSPDFYVYVPYTKAKIQNRKKQNKNFKKKNEKPVHTSKEISTAPSGQAMVMGEETLEGLASKFMPLVTVLPEAKGKTLVGLEPTVTDAVPRMTSKRKVLKLLYVMDVLLMVSKEATWSG